MRALASHQYGPGSIPRLGVIRGLSLLVLFSARRGFPPGTPVFPRVLRFSPLLKNLHLIKFDLNEFQFSVPNQCALTPNKLDTNYYYVGILVRYFRLSRRLGALRVILSGCQFLEHFVLYDLGTFRLLFSKRFLLQFAKFGEKGNTSVNNFGPFF